ncbi:hypothetical protein Golomagni_07085 [Golovinomyces magnicellulatus]|nr:hypothetical protein Golomagni_07085 [Golovinomyces magnicellulatus]
MPPHPDPKASQFVSTLHHDTYPLVANSCHQNHAIFISGASKGIGRETALSFARSGASTIIIAARSSLNAVEDKIQAISPTTKVIKLNLDISSEDSVNAAVAEIKSQVSSIDVLFNNAGCLETFKTFTDSDPSEWWNTWNINIKGLYLVSRALIPFVLASKLRTIVNVSSIAALCLSPGASSYQTTKLAVLKLTEYMDLEYGSQGLLAYAIHPGAVATELSSNMPKKTHGILIDNASLCADVVSWLTQEKRDWLAGRYISVNWDMEELLAKKDEIIEDDKLKMRIQWQRHTRRYQQATQQPTEPQHEQQSLFEHN